MTVNYLLKVGAKVQKKGGRLECFYKIQQFFRELREKKTTA